MEDKLIEWAIATLGPGAGIAVAMWLYARKTEPRHPDVIGDLFARLDRLEDSMSDVKADIAVLKDRSNR